MSDSPEVPTTAGSSEVPLAEGAERRIDLIRDVSGLPSDAAFAALAAVSGATADELRSEIEAEARTPPIVADAHALELDARRAGTDPVPFVDRALRVAFARRVETLPPATADVYRVALMEYRRRERDAAERAAPREPVAAEPTAISHAAVPSPWAGKPGWEDEPEIPILHVDKKVADSVPKEPAYVVFNRLVAHRGYRPFRLSTGEPRIAIPTDRGLVTLDPSEESFSDWVGYHEFTREGEPVPRPRLKIVTTALAQRAISRELPPERVVSLAIRLGARKPCGSYLDMCDPMCRTIVVGPEGWSIEQIGMPVFDRPRHLKALPDPVAPGEGDTEPLWKYVLIAPMEEKASEQKEAPNDGVPARPNQRLLALAGLVQQLVYPASAKTVDVIVGGDGAGKTSTMRALADVLDPSIVATIPPPKRGEEAQLEEAARNRFSVRLDNVSRIAPELSDLLCRLVSGVGIAHRALYTNRDESVSAVCNKLSLNGITATPSASDLLRRTVMYDAVKPSDLNLALLGEAALAEGWEHDHPRILGGLLDLAVKVMQRLRDHPPEDPTDSASSSMVEYVRVGRALSAVLHKSAERFEEAWAANMERQSEGATQDPRMGALLEFWAERAAGSDAVTSSDLAREVTLRAGADAKDGVTPEQAGRLMARAMRLLETKGVRIEKTTMHGHRPGYRRIENAPLKGGSTSLPPPKSDFSDDKPAGEVTGEVGGRYGTYLPPSSGGGRGSADFSDGRGEVGEVGEVVLTKPQNRTVPPSNPSPATGEDREKLEHRLRFLLASRKCNASDPDVLDVKRALWGRALHSPCPYCVDLEHHVCRACNRCAGVETPADNHQGSSA